MACGGVCICLFLRLLSHDSFNLVRIGWKVVHNDVFRPPEQRLLLSVLIGSGVQVLATSLILCLCGVLGIFGPYYPVCYIHALCMYLFVLLEKKKIKKEQMHIANVCHS